MQTENVSEMVSNVKAMGLDKDPVVLGVSLPLSVTMNAAMQVKNAWMQAAMDVMSAAKALATEKKTVIAKKASEVTS